MNTYFDTIALGKVDIRKWSHTIFKYQNKLYNQFSEDIKGSLQFLSQCCDLAIHSTFVVCFNFIDKCRNLEFKMYSERHIFEKLVIGILFTLKILARNLIRGSHRINICFYISFCWKFLSWPIHYLLDSKTYAGMQPLT